MIAQLRCQQHPAREAIARCPNCRQSFCRECITEHDGRMLCLPCLAKQAVPPAPPSALWPKLGWSLGAFAGLLLTWAFFLGLGEIFLRASG
ncbi:MAG: rhomboid family protein [Acidobacteria bacterium]|nr:rhomboid family protein [Acidobacteriota bacterium]